MLKQVANLNSAHTNLALGLTRIRSATAGEGECRLQFESASEMRQIGGIVLLADGVWLRMALLRRELHLLRKPNAFGIDTDADAKNRNTKHRNQP